MSMNCVTRRGFLQAAGLLAAMPWAAPVTKAQAAGRGRPNILWLSCEDISPHLGCFGDLHAITPNLDRLAREGVRYSHTFTTAGVCAPCRSGIITGMYQTTLGTHHMRCSAKLPPQIRAFTSYLREAGYYCSGILLHEQLQDRLPDGRSAQRLGRIEPTTRRAICATPGTNRAARPTGASAPRAGPSSPSSISPAVTRAALPVSRNTRASRRTSHPRSDRIRTS